MTWINRLRLFGGIIGVLLIVAVLTLIFNQRQTKATSITATVAADTYDVGAAYGGTVIKQYVKEGDVVQKGDKLFTINSVPLQQDLSNGLDLQSSDAYNVNKTKGTLTYKATVAGQVTDLKAKLGNSLGTGSPFAQISVVGSQYVDAKFLLSPRDYERIEKGAAVDIVLPNNQIITGTVSTVEVATDQGKALTEVRVDSDTLANAELANVNQPGTPVDVTVKLRDDGPLAGTSDTVFDFLRQIGLK
jgi:multidrug resistance efflux pump